MRAIVTALVAVLGAALFAAPASATWTHKGTLAFSLVSSRAEDTDQFSWSSDLDLYITRTLGKKHTAWIYLQDDYGRVRDRDQDVNATLPDRVDYQAKYLYHPSPSYSCFVSYSITGDHDYGDDDHSIGLGLRFPLGGHVLLDVSEERVVGEEWQHKLEVYYTQKLGKRLKATTTTSAAGTGAFNSSADAGLAYQLTREFAVGLNAILTKPNGDANWARTIRFQTIWSLGP